MTADPADAPTRSRRPHPGHGGADRPGGARSVSGYSLISLLVGLALLLFALLIVLIPADLPYTRLLVYAGVASLFSSIGATAAVRLNWRKSGEAGAAGGAAAIAILLCWTIGPDQRPPPQKLNITYYVQFPDGLRRIPAELTASVSIFDDKLNPAGERGSLPISFSPGGGDAVRLTIADISPHNSIILRIHSPRENKSWTSAMLTVTEAFMPVNEGK